MAKASTQELANRPDTTTESRAVPLHQRILVEIEQKIISGEWPPGYRIPFEVELARQYNCSRMTVGKALSQLARGGLLERRRRSGSFVTQPVAQSAVLEIHDIRSEVESLGRSYRYQLLERRVEPASPPDCRRLGIEAGVRVVELECCHFAGSTPFCFERRLINLSTVPSAEAESFGIIAPGPWLLDKVPWSAAEHIIRAIPADARIAAVLRTPVDTSCLSVERRTWSNGDAVTHVRLIYTGESHALVARFEPSQAG